MPERHDSSPPAVLITGTSTGIGAASALDLDAQGWRVFAGVRKESDAERLRQQASERLLPVMLDVTVPDSVRDAAETVRGAVGETGLAGLVNNAGIVVPGPLEMVPLENLRRQFEVNVLGHLAVTQAVLPLLRVRPGRIVNIGSIAGRIAPPYMGAYAASKHALEAITDVLRVELRGWGIHVAIVEPDSVATPIWDKFQTDSDALPEGVSPAVRDLYEEDLLQMRKAAHQMDRTGMPVEKVVRAIRHALCARRPRTRYPLGWRTKLGFWALRSIPARLRDWIVLRMMGVRK
ncbi:MAG TPA: SDR family oxidoreductase [Phycisphaerae bacterium]|nr:SDR family oxidoreductase [Phycisphaerae bacterium]